jgi:alanine racemase
MSSAESALMVLTIDLDAVVANWRALRDRAAPAECAAVVKANAYGLGAEPVSRALAAAGCRTFFVATIDEGIALRAVLPEQRIFVLCGAMAGNGPDLTAHRLIPILNSLDQIATWRAHAAHCGTALAAGLHLDTGMTRLGIDAAEARQLAASPDRLAGIIPTLVMSHMACADEAGSAMNAAQLSAFGAAGAGLAPGVARSLAASSTIYLGADYCFDLVRPGAGLYGLNPIPDRANPMAAVVRLQAKILQVRDVDTPQTVGYGASHRIARKGRIATVAVGYADGWFRSLGNRGQGFIEGEMVPVVGRISMDLTTFDVSGLPPAMVRPGAMIELIGPRHDVDAVAAQAGTIGYEILTALGHRSARRYIGGAS